MLKQLDAWHSAKPVNPRVRFRRHPAFPRGWVFGVMIVVCCLSVSTVLLGQSDILPLPHRDKESWPELDLYCRAGNRLDLTLVSQTRLSTGLPNPALWLLGVDAGILLNRHLLVTPSYYYFRFDKTRGTEQGHNLVLAATFSKSAGRYAIDDRNRVIGFLLPGSDFWAYGNRLRAERSIGPEEKRMALIGWDELFFFSNTDSWQRNRVVLSLHKGITDRLAVEPYFLHQTDGHTRPGNLNAFGLILKARIH